MELNLLPVNIIKLIFQTLDLQDLMSVELTCKLFKQIVRTTKWIHFIVKLRNLKRINHVMMTYMFTKYDFSGSKISDEIIAQLNFTHVTELDLSETPVTEIGISNLKNCQTLKLSGQRITDACVPYLTQCTRLYFSNCDFTLGGVKNLATNNNLEYVHFDNCGFYEFHVRGLFPTKCKVIVEVYEPDYENDHDRDDFGSNPDYDYDYATNGNNCFFSD